MPPWIRWLNGTGWTTSARGSHGRCETAITLTPLSSKRAARGRNVRFISAYSGQTAAARGVQGQTSQRVRAFQSGARDEQHTRQGFLQRSDERRVGKAG